MSKSIIEKLGVTPGPWEKDYGQTMGHIKSVANKDLETPTVARYDSQYKGIIPDGERHKNAQLIAAAPEMLEALIEADEDIQCLLDFIAEDLFEHIPDYHMRLIAKRMYNRQKNVGPKATSRTWAEIKDLL